MKENTQYIFTEKQLKEHDLSLISLCIQCIKDSKGIGTDFGLDCLEQMQNDIKKATYMFSLHKWRKDE